MRDVRNRDMLIWLTYNRYLKKTKKSPQALWNKMEVFMVPEVLSKQT